MRARVLVLDEAPGLWGAQAYLLRMAAPLAQHGVDLVLGASAGLELVEEWRARGLAYQEIALPQAPALGGPDGGRVGAGAMLRQPVALLRSARSIRRAVREVGADLIWANGHVVHLEGALAGRLARIPVVVHLHEEVLHPSGRLRRAAAVGASTRGVAVSGVIAAALPSRLARRVEVIGNGVDVERFAPAAARADVRASLGAMPGDTLLVALTRLDPSKRIEDLIGTTAHLPEEPAWHLTIVGATTSFPAYAEEVRALARGRLGERVTFAGRREDVVDVLNAADVVVHAGVVEGMPLGLLEAQACGRPVVAYSVAGVPDVVVDGVTGLLAPVRDIEALAEHLRALVGDPDRRATIGRAARAEAIARHGLEAQVRGNAEVVATVLGWPLATLSA